MREMRTDATEKSVRENFASRRDREAIGELAQGRARIQRKIRFLRRCGRIHCLSAEPDFPSRVLRSRTPVQTSALRRAIPIVISEPLAKSKRRPGKSRRGLRRGCVEESNTWELT